MSCKVMTRNIMSSNMWCKLCIIYIHRYCRYVVFSLWPCVTVYEKNLTTKPLFSSSQHQHICSFYYNNSPFFVAFTFFFLLRVQLSYKHQTLKQITSPLRQAVTCIRYLVSYLFFYHRQFFIPPLTHSQQRLYTSTRTQAQFSPLLLKTTALFLVLLFN